MALTTAEAGYRLPVHGEGRMHRPVNPLRQALDRWLSVLAERALPETYYTKALRSLRRSNLRPDPEEALATLSLYADSEDVPRLGLFLSACYTQSRDRTIVYCPQPDLPLTDIGFFLPKQKKLLLVAGDALAEAGKVRV